MKKRFLIGLLLLLLLSTYSSKNSIDNQYKLNIKEIIVENNNILKKKEVKEEFSFLYNQNIFLLNDKTIAQNLSKKSFIESFKIKKIYPDKIKIVVFEKQPIAILQNKKEKHYYTNKNEIIEFSNLREFKNLPIVFSDKKNFKIFYNDLKKIEFPLNIIKSLQFFKSQRWDIITRKDQTIKLPTSEYKKSLRNFLEIKNKDNFNRYKIFDYRIKDQLILK